jgi:uncharacterized protein
MSALALREQDLHALHRVFQRFLGVREVRVFGSRATGEARRASDIDLAISAPEAGAAEWADLVEALEDCPVIHEIDVVRVERVGSQRLLEKIGREGVRIYPRT